MILPVFDPLLLNLRGERLAFREALRALDPHCLYCRLRLGRKAATLDHVIPIARGGTHHVGNLVLACRHCNAAKRERTAQEWLDDLRHACERLALVRSLESGVRLAR